MRRHPVALRYTLIAALLFSFQSQILDRIVRIFLKLVKRIDKKAQRELEKKYAGNLRKVFGKNQILFKVAKVVTSEPEGVVKDVVFPKVSLDIFQRLIEEAEQMESSFEVVKTKASLKKYVHHYRRMVGPMLRTLNFKSENPSQKPLLQGIELIKRYLDTKHAYFPNKEIIPEQLLSTGHWRELVVEEGADGERFKRYPFELCVLSKLSVALKCKEIWVEGAYRFRNPVEDLPKDWPKQRVEYCKQWNIPLTAGEFLLPIRRKMLTSLESFHKFLESNQGDVNIKHPGGGERGLFHVPKLLCRPERTILREIKGKIIDKWGILDLLDILIEVDRHINFVQFFHTSGEYQVLSKDEARKRLLLCLFSLGTNLGLKRIYTAAQPDCSYDDLRYFQSRYVTINAVRSAITALVNRILELRNPAIWGNGTSCASDAKHFAAWDQNLKAELNPHYDKKGVMVYWHVTTNSLCIFSQLKTCFASEVAAMIRGLVQHDTEMRVETNFVDSHGQSELAFALCGLLGFKLRPRLKRLKYERLYLPEKGMTSKFPNFAGVLAQRPIRWNLIEEQYDEMAKHAVAIAEGTGPVESILSRFNSYNRTHPTYKAFLELGKAEKTCFLCDCLTQPSLRQEMRESSNVIENFNSCADFIGYGRRSELQTNDPETQELILLSLHLLQNSLLLVNTLMIEEVLKGDLIERMKPEDLQSLTPLFTSNVNPYGTFKLNMERPSLLEVV